MAVPSVLRRDLRAVRRTSSGLCTRRVNGHAHLCETPTWLMSVASAILQTCAPVRSPPQHFGPMPRGLSTDAHTLDPCNKPARHRTERPLFRGDLSPSPEPSIHRTHRPKPHKQKRRVSRETRRPFPAHRLTIKPSSSPTRDTSRSPADSAQARPPALPAQTRPSPAHSRSRRSAAPPVRSARSAASQRRCRATR